MGRMQRDKGARAERELLALLTDDLALDRPLRRNLAQPRGGGADAELDALPGWAIECKNQARLERPTWWRQAIVQARRAGPAVRPVLFYRIPRKRGLPLREAWRAVVELDLLPQRLLAPRDRVPGPPSGIEIPYDEAVGLIAALILCEAS